MPGSVLFGALDFLPVRPHLVHVLDFNVPENVRMSANQFVGDVAGNFFKIKSAPFVGELAMKDDLEEKVTEFFGHLVVIAGLDGIEQFINLLDRVPAQCAMILLTVPGTSFG